MIFHMSQLGNLTSSPMVGFHLPQVRILLIAGADPEIQRSSKRRRPQDLARDLDTRPVGPPSVGHPQMVVGGIPPNMSEQLQGKKGIIVVCPEKSW